MPRTCTVCRHAERAAIDAALVTGTPRRELAGRFSLSEPAVRRHAEAHLTEALARASADEKASDARLRERVLRIVTDLEGMAAGARAGGDGEAYRRTARELLRGLELLGRVTGELST